MGTPLWIPFLITVLLKGHTISEMIILLCNLVITKYLSKLLPTKKQTTDVQFNKLVIHIETVQIYIYIYIGYKKLLKFLFSFRLFYTHAAPFHCFSFMGMFHEPTCW